MQEIIEKMTAGKQKSFHFINSKYQNILGLKLAFIIVPKNFKV